MSPNITNLPEGNFTSPHNKIDEGLGYGYAIRVFSYLAVSIAGGLIGLFCCVKKLCKNLNSGNLNPKTRYIYVTSQHNMDELSSQPNEDYPECYGPHSRYSPKSRDDQSTTFVNTELQAPVSQAPDAVHGSPYTKGEYKIDEHSKNKTNSQIS